MNDRFFARVLLLRGIAGGEFLVLFIALVALAAVAGVGSTSEMVAADPVAARLVNGVPRMIFAGLVIVSPLVVVRLAAADRTAGWTAPLFAGGRSAATYVLALAASVSVASAAMLTASSLAFHAVARSLGADVFARMLTGTLSLVALCAYAAVLWLLMYDRTRTLLAMLVVWVGPLALGVSLAIAKGMTDPPLWLEILLVLLPPVRMSDTLAPAVIQAAYIALLAAVLIARSPKQVPLWR